MIRNNLNPNIFFASLLLALLLVCAPRLVNAQAVVGAAAPQFTAKDSKGNAVSLSDFKGKVVVLEWFNPNCPFIKKFYKNGAMQKQQSELTAKGVVWLTINSSAPGKNGHLSPDGAEASRNELGMKSSALLLDSDGGVGKAYGARITPHMFIVKGDGTVAYAGAVDSEPSTDSDDIAGATNYVTAAVEALLAGKAVEAPSTEPYGCPIKY